MAPRSNLVLRAYRLPRNRSLTVVVRDAEGNAVPGVHLAVSKDDDRPIYRTPPETDFAGRIELTHLWAEPIDVRILEVPQELSERGMVVPEPITVTPAGQQIVLKYQKPPGR